MGLAGTLLNLWFYEGVFLKVLLVIGIGICLATGIVLLCEKRLSQTRFKRLVGWSATDWTFLILGFSMAFSGVGLWINVFKLLSGGFSVGLRVAMFIGAIMIWAGAWFIGTSMGQAMRSLMQIRAKK